MVFECKGDKISRSLYGPVRRSCTYCAAFLRGAVRGLTARLNCATVWRDGRRVQQPNPPSPRVKGKRVGCLNLKFIALFSYLLMVYKEIIYIQNLIITSVLDFTLFNEKVFQTLLVLGIAEELRPFGNHPFSLKHLAQTA